MRLIERLSKSKLFAVVCLLFLTAIFIPSARAASLDSISDKMSRIKDSTASNHTIQFDLGGSTALDASETIVLTFPTGYNLTALANSDANDYDIQVAATDESIVAAGACASNDAIEITSISGQIITFTACSSYTAEAAGSTIILEIGTNATTGGTGDSQIVNQTVAQNNSDAVVTITAAGDTGAFATEIISEDQIQVTADVDPSLTFTLVTTAFALSTITTSAVSTSSANAFTVGTNGYLGYTVYINDIGDSGGNDGLYNSDTTDLIASADATLSAGTEGYGAQCQKTAGDGSCDATFNYWGTEQVGGLLTTQDILASHGSKPSATGQFELRVKAAISSTTDAGDYADTLTVTATGNF